MEVNRDSDGNNKSYKLSKNRWYIVERDKVIGKL